MIFALFSFSCNTWIWFCNSLITATPWFNCCFKSFTSFSSSAILSNCSLFPKCEYLSTEDWCRLGDCGFDFAMSSALSVRIFDKLLHDVLSAICFLNEPLEFARWCKDLILSCLVCGDWRSLSNSSLICACWGDDCTIFDWIRWWTGWLDFCCVDCCEGVGDAKNF